MKRIPPKALEWQENHKDNGNDVASSNKEQKNTQTERKKSFNLQQTPHHP
jgi:hypothetical protein